MCVRKRAIIPNIKYTYTIYKTQYLSLNCEFGLSGRRMSMCMSECVIMDHAANRKEAVTYKLCGWREEKERQRQRILRSFTILN